MAKRRVKQTAKLNTIEYWFRADNKLAATAQWSNLPIFIATVSFLVIIFTPRNYLQLTAQLGFVFGLGYWSWFETRYGINRFRRTLGVMTSLIVILMGFVFVSGM